MRSALRRVLRLVCVCCVCMVVAGCATPPQETSRGPWSFAVVADNRGGGQSHRAVLESIKAANHEMILNLGDIVHPTEGHHWQDFMADMEAVFGDDMPSLLKRYYLSVGGWEEQYINRSRRATDPKISQADWKYAGNFTWPGYEPDNAAGQYFVDKHFNYRERAGKEGSEFVDYDEHGDYHVKYRDLHILSLYLTDEWHREEVFGPHDDPQMRAQIWDEQVLWLDARLKEIRGSSPEAVVIVMGHDSDWVAQEGDSFRGRLCELMAKSGVDIAFCGDGHRYIFYPDPTTLKFMVPACLGEEGGGYMSVTVDGPQLSVRHCDRNGQVLDVFQKTAGEPVQNRTSP